MKLYRITCCLLVLLLSLVAFAFVAIHPAYGEATVTRFEFQFTFTDVGGNECLPPSEPLGAITGTDKVAGQFTETTQGFHVHGTDSLDYRVAFPDGTYILGAAVTDLDFNVNLQPE